MTSEKELAEAQADLAYWKQVADVVDCSVIGWTYRQRATLMNISENTIQIPGWFAEKLLRINKEATNV